jgi:predicted ATPase
VASGTAKGLVGRGTELATLVDRLTCDGGPTGVVLHGEPGVGKTALLAAIGAAAEGTGCIVLQGRCIDIGESWPYHPLRDAMREAACVSVEPVRSLLDGLQQDLATPSTAPLLERLHRGMLSLTERAPVVLIFDDFQWADRGTARLALTLLSEQRGPRLRLVASVRTEDVGRTTRLNEAFLRLRRAGVLDVLSIAPLDFDATVELANRVRGDQLMPAEARTLWNRTEGNPFLIGELALAPLEGGAPRTFKDLAGC